MDYVNIGKTACDYCLIKGIKHFTIFDIWGLFGEDWDVENQSTLNLEEIEKTAIKKALKVSSDIQVQAAKLLGITPRVLLYKMRKHNIETWRQKETIHFIDDSPKSIKDWKLIKEKELCEI